MRSTLVYSDFIPEQYHKTRTTSFSWYISNHWPTVKTGAWIKNKEEPAPRPQCCLACGLAYFSPSSPPRWQQASSCHLGAPPPHLPPPPSSPASSGRVEPPVEQSSVSKVQENCAEGRGTGEHKFLFLAVQNTSIGDLITQSLTD